MPQAAQLTYKNDTYFPLCRGYATLVAFACRTKSNRTERVIDEREPWTAACAFLSWRGFFALRLALLGGYGLWWTQGPLLEDTATRGKSCFRGVRSTSTTPSALVGSFYVPHQTHTQRKNAHTHRPKHTHSFASYLCDALCLFAMLIPLHQPFEALQLATQHRTEHRGEMSTSLTLHAHTPYTCISVCLCSYCFIFCAHRRKRTRKINGKTNIKWWEMIMCHPENNVDVKNLSPPDTAEIGWDIKNPERGTKRDRDKELYTHCTNKTVGCATAPRQTRQRAAYREHDLCQRAGQKGRPGGEG